MSLPHPTKVRSKAFRNSATLGINRSGISDIRVVCRTGGIRVAGIEIVK